MTRYSTYEAVHASSKISLFCGEGLSQEYVIPAGTYGVVRYVCEDGVLGVYWFDHDFIGEVMPDSVAVN